ncbi:HEAT repeat domain-containing protein [Paraeggerthella sp. LCP19S3_G8]|uniref:HEAT repeat domain-containing protein n=1 Tax=Paraeggerthella sp. LCP19S3_G8 TaxID=3440248 RepID=UPI003F94D1E3
MSEKTQGTKTIAEEALGNERQFIQLVNALSGPSRRGRQNAAAALAFLSKDHADLFVPYGDAFIDALNRPEAQTRWECLDVLAGMVDHDSRTCDKAVPGAETALFDEESGPVRLAAMRFLCKLGATTENRSERIWPLIDEAIHCYHGDFEFQDMLVAVVDFSSGKLSSQVKDELASRMAFDASNGKGALKRRAQQILDNVQSK